MFQYFFASDSSKNNLEAFVHRKIGISVKFAFDNLIADSIDFPANIQIFEYVDIKKKKNVVKLMKIFLFFLSSRLKTIL